MLPAVSVSESGIEKEYPAVFSSIVPTAVFCEIVSALMLESPKVAVPDAVGTAGDQLAAVFQLPDDGVGSHVALCARAGIGGANSAVDNATRGAVSRYGDAARAEVPLPRRDRLPGATARR